MRIRDLMQRNRPTSLAISRAPDIFDPTSSLQSQINRVFSDFLSNDNWPMLSSMQGTQRSGFVIPSIEVTESDQNFIVTAELPGLSKDEVDVSINDNAITISGEKREERQEEQGNCLVSERAYGSFQRLIPLPESANADNAQAVFKNGVLCIEIPKREESVSRSRKLEVSASNENMAQQQSRSSGRVSEETSASGRQSQTASSKEMAGAGSSYQGSSNKNKQSDPSSVA